MSYDNNEMIAVAVELLTEFGFAVSIRSEATTGYNPATLTATQSNASADGLAAFFDPSNSNMTGYEKTLPADTIKSGKWLYVQSDTEPKPGDVLVAGSREFKIHASTCIGPTTPPVFYRVMTTEIT